MSNSGKINIDTEVEVCSEESLVSSIFSLGKIVEVRSAIDKAEVVWVLATVAKELEGGKFVVKDCNGLNTALVDAHRIRPTLPPLSVKEFEMFEKVEVFRGSGWHQGIVRGILSGKRYIISFVGTKDESVFEHSSLRPLMVWEDGVWRDGPKGKSVEETPLEVAKEKPETPEMALKCVRRALNVEESSETLSKCETLLVKTPQVTSIANESVSPVTLVKPTETETEGKKFSENIPEPARNQNGLGSNSAQQQEEKCKNYTRKRKREQQDNEDLNESELASNQSPNIAASTPRLLLLPFNKKSPYWKRYKSMEGFKSVPQHPHFSPLLEANNDIREWSAVGMMVTYYMLLDEVKALKLNDPSSKLDELCDSFAKLEKYGFVIATPQARISKVLSLQDERSKKAEERKCLENKIEEEECEKQKLEEERAELKCKILELQREDRIAEEMEEATAKRILDMKASASRIDQEIEDLKVEFEGTI